MGDVMFDKCRKLSEFAKMRFDMWRNRDDCQSRLAGEDGESEINNLLDSYPRNHNYQVQNGKMAPSWRLFQRVSTMAPIYPDRVDSLLDISSCKGYFVLSTAVKHMNSRAVGVDIYEPFISVANRVKAYLGVTNASFHNATIDEILNEPDVFGWSFQVVMFLGSYHYFFWGSRCSSNAFYDHHEILRRVSKLCSDRVVFSGRLEINRLPHWLREKVRTHEAAELYNKKCFLEMAEKYFEITKVGRLGKDDLFLLKK